MADLALSSRYNHLRQKDDLAVVINLHKLGHTFKEALNV